MKRQTKLQRRRPSFILGTVASALVLAACAADTSPSCADCIETEIPDCRDTAIALLTEPGRVSAAMPDLLTAADPSEGLLQVPKAGVRLEPGQQIAVVTRENTPLCQVAIDVTLDEDGGALPDGFLLVPASDDGVAELGETPTIVYDELVDELGRPVEMTVTIDGTSIGNDDPSEHPDRYASHGNHRTEVELEDSFGRKLRLKLSEWYQALNEKLDEYDEYLKEQERLSWLDKAPGIAEGCECRVVKKNIEWKDCKSRRATAEGWEHYDCTAQNLRTFANEVEDGFDRPESLASVDSGGRTDDWTIECRTGPEQPVSSCVECCPNPVIIAQFETKIGGLKAYAESKNDRANLNVHLVSSGIGNFKVSSSVASGAQSYTLVNGISTSARAGISGGVENLDAEANGQASIQVSAETKTTYRGAGSGWRTQAPITPTYITGWARGTCEQRHNVSVSFNSDLEAHFGGLPGWGILYDKAASQIAQEADIDYVKVTYRCDGKTPTLGSAQ